MRKAARLVGDCVLVEEDRPGNVRGLVFGLWIAVLCRQVPGRINDLDRRIAETLSSQSAETTKLLLFSPVSFIVVTPLQRRASIRQRRCTTLNRFRIPLT